MRILVTGGAGYIGSILVPELLARGHAVAVLDSFRFRQSSLLDVCHHPKLEVVRGDARDRELMARHIAGVDLIIPLAALVGAPLCDKEPLESESTNVGAVKLLLELRNPGQKIIFPTTNSGYGIGEKGVFCTEETPLNPISRYGRQKVEAERLILDDANAITLRLATVFGVSPRMRLDLLVNDFVYRAVTDRCLVLFEADFKRNYLHIRDVARAFLHGIENFERMKNEPYNVGLSDANLSKRELCGEIKKQIPDFYFTEATVGEDPDKRDYIVSNEKIERTGFKPAYSLGDGIRELIKGYRIIRGGRYANI
ncbi:MAG: NAD(P)-dependent oxidoreductase [Candidatus Sungbacteria bacterium]|uniref:NAD(P)-dependent oxidoreductase n=1 Tax=Candidatus Sungiibacteriota bacterium TaxID=2750080 RepID=A0A932YVS0_9BACT|nr:NAD(P)-dependent oxidoreductase [Candidatus Sungbacteria bacterium]